MGALQNSRSLSLDVFRGLTVCFMIIVNTPGSGATPFAPLLHAQWHGFTPTDLVFPSFLFAVGNAMSFSMGKFVSEKQFLFKVIKRTILIFVLGYLMYWFPFFATDDVGNFGLTPIAKTRVMGVLQRIALCYFFASLLIRYLSTRSVIIVSILLLVGYWFLLLVFSSHGDPYDMVNNVGTQLDKYILGDDHLYHGEGVPFDPEGILGTLPAIVNVIIGYYAGKFVKEPGHNYETTARLLLAGGVLILTALAWNNYFPINKKLWSGSFVLLTTGLDLAILAALIYIIEIKSFNPLNWTKFFTIFGKNPLFIYLLSELLVISFWKISMAGNESFYTWINSNVFQNILPGPFGSLLFAVTFMLLCWSVGWWLDKKKVYVRV
jgi:predicted acyltransferase